MWKLKKKTGEVGTVSMLIRKDVKIKERVPEIVLSMLKRVED